MAKILKCDDCGSIIQVLVEDDGDTCDTHMLAIPVQTEGIKRAIQMQTIIVARCETCNSEWQNIHMGSAGQTNQEAKYWLTTYRTELKGDILYVSNW